MVFQVDELLQEEMIKRGITPHGYFDVPFPFGDITLSFHRGPKYKLVMSKFQEADEIESTCENLGIKVKRRIGSWYLLPRDPENEMLFRLAFSHKFWPKYAM